MSRISWKLVALKLGMFLGFIALTFGAGTALLLWTRSEPPIDITQSLRPHGHGCSPGCLLFGALIGFWPGFCRCVARWRGLRRPARTAPSSPLACGGLAFRARALLGRTSPGGSSCTP